MNYILKATDDAFLQHQTLERRLRTAGEKSDNARIRIPGQIRSVAPTGCNDHATVEIQCALRTVTGFCQELVAEQDPVLAAPVLAGGPDS